MIWLCAGLFLGGVQLPPGVSNGCRQPQVTDPGQEIVRLITLHCSYCTDQTNEI